jgi:hypothetical protein
MYLKPRAITWPGGTTHSLPYLNDVPGSELVEDWYKYGRQLTAFEWDEYDCIDVETADDANKVYLEWVHDQLAAAAIN